MKKFINDPKNLTRELLEGFAIAHRGYYHRQVREDRVPGKTQAGEQGGDRDAGRGRA